jgi:uncharacterized SAM-binding protein YcdF (DUF218 family)
MSRSSRGGDRRRRAWVGLTAGALGGLIIVDLGLPSLFSYWGDRTIFVPAAALVGAALWMTPLRRLALLAVVLLGVLWLTVAFTPVTRWMAEGLVRRDALQAGDAVFVLGSRIQMDGDPTTDAMSRLLRGLELAAEGRARHLIVSETPGPQGRYAPLAEAWTTLFAPGTEVVAVGPIFNTHDEAQAAEALFSERGWKRVLLVTSPTHTRRAAATFETLGLDVIAVPAVETRFDLETLDLPGDRREAFSALAHEWVGLFVYRQRGWID